MILIIKICEISEVLKVYFRWEIMPLLRGHIS